KEWEPGLDGKPKPPWAFVYVVYMCDLESAEIYTFINSTFGARIAYERLTQKLELMTRLRGAGVTALVKPDSRQMKTKVGPKLRPEFTILEWRDLGSEPQPAQLPPPTDKDLPAGAAVKPPAEPAAAGAAKAPADKKKRLRAGKPVAPPTAAEELNDRIPDEFI